jgi:D-alanyl-D-alanine carboxypeptidase
MTSCVRDPRLPPSAGGLALLLLLAGCGQQGRGYAGDGFVPYDGTIPAADRAGRARGVAPSRFYPPPGPSDDPWGPYVREAASRFRVPEQWVRAVMRQESGGREQAVSSAGAMGLMQVMPATYAGLRSRHGLGDDPYNPHDNVLAGTAYLREMFDRYGSPGFLAAYNAGPDRLDSYLAGSGSLPDETVNYLAAITPNLGRDVPMSGPLAAYADARVPPSAGMPSTASLASGCDVNAAYDPDRTCARLELAAATPVRTATADGCDPDAAYDPDRPCSAASSAGEAPSRPVEAPPHPVEAPFRPRAARPAYVEASASGPFAAAVPQRSAAAPSAAWAIQVGAFANPGLARAVAEGARAEAPDQLRSAQVALPTTTPFGGAPLYRARIEHLSASAAAAACQRLNQRQLPCVVVQPARS